MGYNFAEVINNFDRMCRVLGQMHCDPEECPISALIDLWERAHKDEWNGHCLNFAREMPNRFAEEVMKWAEAHEEPVYPTIREVMSKICTLMHINLAADPNDYLDERLTKKAADYFGIKPINEDKLV